MWGEGILHMRIISDQRNNLRSDLVKLYICLKQIIINYGN